MTLGLGEWLGIAGLVLAIVAIPITYILSRRTLQHPDLRTTTDFDELVTPGGQLFAGGLRLTFNEENITSVSRTYVAFWNHRGATVRGNDSVSSDPLRILVGEDDSVLQARIVALSRQQIGVDVTVGTADPRAVAVEFDYLDAGDGFVVEVLHHGDASAVVSGTVRGGKIRNSRSIALNYRARERRRMRALPRTIEILKTKGTIPLHVAMVGMIVGTVWLIADLVNSSRLPMLVNQGAYELDTLSGQAEFASRVRSIGQNMPEQWFMAGVAVGVTVVMFMTYLYVVHGVMASAIPRSVLAVELTEPAASHRTPGQV